MKRIGWTFAAVAALATTLEAQEPGAVAAPENEDQALTTLKAVMPELALAATRIQEALWREDFETIGREAHAVSSHAGLSKEEQERIIGKLGKETAWFSEADVKVHKAAVAIEAAAQKKDAEKVAAELAVMQSGCVACHSHYRAKLRK